MKKVALFILLASSLMVGTAEARISGVDWLNLPINGTDYEVPLYNDDAKAEFYLVYKALHGDEEARDVVLGGKLEKLIFIGDGDRVLWLHMTKNEEWVTEAA